MMHGISERAGVVLLEKVFLRASLRAADQVDGGIEEEGQHQRCYDSLVICKVTQQRP